MKYSQNKGAGNVTRRSGKIKLPWNGGSVIRQALGGSIRVGKLLFHDGNSDRHFLPSKSRVNTTCFKTLKLHTFLVFQYRFVLNNVYRVQNHPIHRQQRVYDAPISFPCRKLVFLYIQTYLVWFLFVYSGQRIYLNLNSIIFFLIL